MKGMKQRKGGARLLAFVLGIWMAASSFGIFAGAEEISFPNGAASVHITMDGKTVLEGEAAIIDSVTYVPLRKFATLAGADSVEWDPRTSTATVRKGTVEISVTDGYYYVVASGRYFYTVAPIRNIDGRLYVPVRPLAKCFSMELAWNGSTRTVSLITTKKSLIPASEFYSSDDLYWLSRIISAESAGESLYGQIAVGNVVLNRVRHRQYPNTVYGVIFDRVGGIQFTPVAIGTVYKTPSEKSVIAAKICLEGYSISEDVLFFMNPRISTSNWISKNRPFAFRIGNHDFYR